MMTPTEIMDRLRWYDDALPRKALEAAILNRDAIIPLLLQELEYTTDHVEELLDEPNYMAHIYAMFLLAQFREVRAYPLLIKLFLNPGEAIHELTGDIITEDLRRILACVCGGDIDPIKALAENQQADEYVRSAALHSLGVLVAQGVKSREEILNYFQSLYREKLPRDGHFIWSSLVSVSTDLYPDLVYEDIKQAFADDLVDLMVIDMDFIDGDMAPGKEVVLERLRDSRFNQMIDNTIAELETWAAFRPNRRPDTGMTLEMPDGQVVRQGHKVGRNEPCPCGSGKKYKRCCGRKR
jgi:hypothetical protein